MQIEYRSLRYSSENWELFTKYRFIFLLLICDIWATQPISQSPRGRSAAQARSFLGLLQRDDRSPYDGRSLLQRQGAGARLARKRYAASLRCRRNHRQHPRYEPCRRQRASRLLCLRANCRHKCRAGTCGLTSQAKHDLLHRIERKAPRLTHPGLVNDS